MNKIYQRIDWENYPSSATPLNEDNLNKMDYAIDKLDDRIVTHETTKLNTATGNTLVKNVTFNEKTGVFTIEKLSGSKITINTALEKISTNFHFNPTTQKLVLTLIDGTVQEIDLSALITQYEFLESDTITFEIDASGKVKANILNGSITGKKLEPNYLANVTLQAKNAKTSADNAKTSEELAYQYAEEAKESASQTAKSDAKNITYDNTESGLSATNVKDALDEVAQGSVSAIAIDTTITDSTNAPLVSLKVKGKTEQTQYTGKNLLNTTLGTTTTNGVTCTKNSDGTYTLNGTASKNTLFKLCDVNMSYSNKVRLVGCSGGNGTTFFLYVITESGERHDTGNGSIVNENVRIDSCFICVKEGIAVNNLVFKPMITTDLTATYDDFEPYCGGTASPNPDYPQEIEGLDKVSVKTCGKNIFGGLLFAQSIVDTGSTNVVLDTDAKTITFSYNTNYEKKKALFSNFKENTRYTVILNGTSTSDNGKDSQILFQYTDGTFEWIDIGIYVSAENKTVKEIFYHYKSQFYNTLNYEKCGIFEGVITVDDFAPYTETVAEFDLTDPLYEGDYIEYRADGSGVLHRKMASVVINGKNGISEYHITTNGTFAVSKSGLGIYNIISYGTKVICDYLLNKTLSSMVSGEKGICNLNDAFIYINLTGSASTVDEAKAWLAENPITVVYELAEPTEIELTAEQVAEFKKLYTFEPITNVFCEGETEIQYYKNTDSGETVAMVSKKADNSVSKSNSLENRLSKSLVSTETINIDSLSLSSGGLSTITSEEISKSGYTLVGAKFFLRGSYAENIIASFTIGGSSTKIYNFAFYNPSDYDISAYGYVDLIYVANSL